MDKSLLDKYEELKAYIASFGSVAIAFSSGVDSTFLLYAAKEALGDKLIAVTASVDIKKAWHMQGITSRMLYSVCRY